MTSSVLVILCAMAMLPACNQNKGSKPVEFKQQTVSAKDQWRTLEIEDIQLEDDVENTVSMTRNFYFIIDGSGSMSELPETCGSSEQGFKDKMEGARWAIRQFLEKVPDDVNVGLLAFDRTGAKERIPLQPLDRDLFLNQIDAIRPGGKTPLANAIGFGAKKLIEQYKKQLGYGEYRLVIVTDGVASNIPRAAVNAAKKGIPIYTIGLCIDSNHPLKDYSISYRSANSFEDMKSGLEETLAELPSFDPEEFTGL